MEKLNYYDEEEKEKVIAPPYYRVMYIDDEGRTHLATIKDKLYLQFLQDRFIIKECVYVAE